MARDQDIYKIIDLVVSLFPDCVVWERSQIGLNPEIWSFSLPELKESTFEILVWDGKCQLGSNEYDFAERRVNKTKKKTRHKEIVKYETPEEIALIICEYFIEIQNAENG